MSLLGVSRSLCQDRILLLAAFVVSILEYVLLSGQNINIHYRDCVSYHCPEYSTSTGHLSSCAFHQSGW